MTELPLASFAVCGQIDSLFVPFNCLNMCCKLFSIELEQQQKKIVHVQHNCYKFGEIRFENSVKLNLAIYSTDGIAYAISEVQQLYHKINKNMQDSTIQILLQNKKDNICTHQQPTCITRRSTLKLIFTMIWESVTQCVVLGIGLKQDIDLPLLSATILDVINFDLLEQCQTDLENYYAYDGCSSSSDEEQNYSENSNRSNKFSNYKLKPLINHFRLDIGLRIAQQQDYFKERVILSDKECIVPKFSKKVHNTLCNLLGCTTNYCFSNFFNLQDFRSFKLSNKLYEVVCYNEYSKFYRYNSNFFYLA